MAQIETFDSEAGRSDSPSRRRFCKGTVIGSVCVAGAFLLPVLWHLTHLPGDYWLRQRVDVRCGRDNLGRLYDLKVSAFDPRRLVLEPSELAFLQNTPELRILEINVPYIVNRDWRHEKAFPLHFPTDRYRFFSISAEYRWGDRRWAGSPSDEELLIAAVQRSLADVERDREPPLSLGRLDDRVLEHISHCHNLLVLFLAGNPISDDGLKHLEHLDQLRVLSLEGTQVTDQGMASIARLRSLGFLILNNTRITDAGLERLDALQSLVCIWLEGTHTTKTGVARLAKKLPRLETMRAIDYFGHVWEQVAP